MSELLRVETELFELVVWCSDISRRQQTYLNTLGKRVAVAQLTQSSPNKLQDLSSVVRFAPALTEVSVISMDEAIQVVTPVAQLQLKQPLFFENLQYQFEWTFFTEVDEARLTHRSHLVNEAFRFARGKESKKGITLPHFIGTVNTGNHVGWMRLPLEYTMAGKVHYSQFDFEVLPTKMDLHSDLPTMYKTIDEIFPLWRFSLTEKTEQDAAKGQHRGYFPLLWLANFGELCNQLNQGLKVIAQAPHRRLQAKTSYAKAARLKGRVPHRLSVRVKEDLAAGLQDKRYRVEKKYLSTDTPENRFIKMVVTQSKSRLAEFETKLRHDNQASERQRLSDVFLNKLQLWQQPLQKTLKQSFLKEVGDYRERSRESLVLQQKTGYSTVYRVWQELKFYLDVFAKQSNVSMKSVADIYEVWCFLILRNILLELGFKELATKKQNLTLGAFFEYRLTDGFAGAFQFQRADGVRVKLAHEPPFSKEGKKIRTYLVTQQPDIVLEVTFPEANRQSFIWLFDAKYRIKSEKNRFDTENIDDTDWVPEDAINQMHRYRDALIRLSANEPSLPASKSRPVFGAFALYPGFFDQKNETNPYQDAINEVGVGAFSLLPSAIEQGLSNDNGHYWLLNFLRSQIGSVPSSSSLSAVQEQLYMQEPARIPYYGMKQVLYPNLTMTAALGRQEKRDASYFSSFKQGTAKYYHMPASTFNSKFKDHVATELQLLAVALDDDKTESGKSIFNIWSIKSVKILPRNQITQAQSGKESDLKDPYFLFELGKALTLPHSINEVTTTPFSKSMKLTTLALLDDASIFSDIEEVYKEALISDS